MNTLQTQDSICEAIDIIVQQAINNAGFDRTIQATIVSCTDESIGQYKVRYQNSTFYAYAQSEEDKYSEGAGVYILIQNNDMSRDKFIIGTVDKLGKDYITIVDEADRYDKIGVNCVSIDSEDEEIQMCSYDHEKIYYEGDISIDNDALLRYCETADFLAIQLNVRTDLASEQRRKGIYGLEMELKFQNEHFNEYTRNYTINIDSMSGNPYLYIDKTKQFFTIAIDPDEFLGIVSIRPFCKDFPKKAEDMPNDIFFSDLEIYAAAMIENDELNGTRLVFASPKGFIFNSNVNEIDVEAIVKVNSEPRTAGVQYYWFKEDPSVFSNSDNYSIYGGQGWKCLNNFDIIELEDGSKVNEWLPDTNIKHLKKSDHVAEKTEYKCVAVFGETLIYSEFTVHYPDAQCDIIISSSNGDTFYGGVGNTILTCEVHTRENSSIIPKYYQWIKIDKNNLLTQLSDFTEKNTYEVEALSIDDYADYKCSVYDKDNKQIGSSYITLVNMKGVEGVPTLSIENGSQIFIYNEDGLAPTSKALENPQIIVPLKVVLFDAQGRPVDDEIIGQLDFTWKIPKENTLLVVNDAEDGADGYYYASTVYLNYSIASSYSIIKNNNTIELEVSYQGNTLKAYTNFLFIKEGEMGTNGTSVIARISAVDLTQGEDPMMYILNEKTHSNFSSLEFNLYFEGEPVNSDSLKWDILKTGEDTSSLSQPGPNPVLTRFNIIDENILIAEATLNSKKYFTTLPMITAELTDENVIPYLKNGTGFRSVIYSSDGANPRYSSAIPFEIGLKKSNGEEITDFENYIFIWSSMGGLLTSLTKAEEINLKTHKFKPAEKYDGRSVNLAVLCGVAHKNNPSKIIASMHIPIHFYLNTYGYSALNDWNGNSIDINDGGYILSPQFGAGIKNANNTFTGLLMGKVKLDKNSNEKTGLIGLNNGVQTIFLDAETGRAEFGQFGSGQIRIIPGQEAVIEGGNYGIESGKGLQINLSGDNAGITFGSGYFSVNKDGHLHASRGDIGGFIIRGDAILKGNEDIGPTSTNKEGIYFGSGGLNISGGTAETTSYITKNQVNIGGKLLFSFNQDTSKYELTVNGNITTNLLNATGGTVGCWTLDSNRMYDATKSAGVNKSGQGMAFWAGVASDLKGTNAPFYVQHDGKMHASNVDITGVISATEIKANLMYSIWDSSFETTVPVIWTGEDWTQTNSVVYMGILKRPDPFSAWPYTLYTMETTGDSASIASSASYIHLNAASHYLISLSPTGIEFQDFCPVTIKKGFCFSFNGYSQGYGLTINSDSKEVYVESLAVYNKTTEYESNVRIATSGDNQGKFFRHKASSSRRYKHDIKDLSLSDIYGLYDVPVRTFKYNLDYLSKDSERYNKDIPGFIAEEIEEVNPILVDHPDDPNKAEMWNNKIMVPCLLKLIQHNHEEINNLKQQVKQLQAKLDNI